jgi:anaerobic glycerol-3-phosphate dehydrogenase
MPYDAVIIGTGLAGLPTSTKLTTTERNGDQTHD